MNQARPSRRLVIVAITVGILGLAPAALAMFIARVMTYGLYPWLEPQLDANIWLPLLGFSLSLCLGPAIMTLGVFVAAAVIASLATWVQLRGRAGRPASHSCSTSPRKPLLHPPNDLGEVAVSHVQVGNL